MELRAQIVFLALFALCLLQDSHSKVFVGDEAPGEVCVLEEGVRGRCEETRECKRNGGVTRRNGVVKLCTAKDDGKVYVCCRRPFEIARELCKSWKYYWRDNKGKCITKKSLIAGGELALIGEFPEIGLIGIKDGNSIKWVCGGTVISPYFVLTAAHCVIEKLPYVIRFGEHDLLYPERQNITRVIGSVPPGLYREDDLHYEKRNKVTIEQTVDIQDVFIHPEYDLRYNDVALLLLAEPVVFTKRTLPACLPTHSEENYEGKLLTVAGWGMLGFNERGISPELMKVNIPVIPSRECSQEMQKKSKYLIPRGILTRQMCAGEVGKNACKGDSGGSLAYQERDDPSLEPCEHTAVGIVSFGYGCGRLSVYTRTSSYIDWITGYIAPKLVPAKI